ncbi:hypothetical protein NX722_23520 [Endozoicomonas gorgoniicola]|uniref:Coil containing protein n=1 Tax=Endozoicomonas gorgoniicola TaxID=1234144 RepID=A0ABT3N1M4_9GAMM|nr:hypothetical protein [Endozoicomonas gorgoniicola]MCW7555537.1 hypothetical protein [Endozoicomonas gorgoniicola]
MSWLSKALNAVTGDLAGEVFGLVKAYLPPSMSEQDQAKLQVTLKQLQDKKELQTQEAETQALQEFNQRIRDLEGTAADLKTIPVLGPLVIFLRGCQRPLWGYLTMYLDVMWFSSWELSQQQQTAMIAINLLVLPFLFGERALKNLEPLLVRLFGKTSRD